MLKDKYRITVRQAVLIFIVSTLSAAIRLFPALSAKFGELAGWISPLISSIALLLIIIMLNTLFQNPRITNLMDAFDLSLGKIGGKITLVLFLIWSLLLYFVYIRYYAERLLSSSYPNVDIRFFILVMMLMIYMVLRGRLSAFARFCEVSFFIFTVVLVVFFLLLIPTVKISNLWPLTYKDIVPAVKGTYPIIGIWGYITFVFFMGDQILNKEQLLQTSKKPILFLAVMTTLMIIFVVGSIGYKTVQRMPLPFFNATKIISALGILDRLESILLAIWVVSDFIAISFFGFVIKHMIKSLFHMNETKHLASPLALLGYIGGLYMTSNRFEFELFSSTLGLSVNIVICFIVPILIFTIGKIRKKI